MDNSLFYGDFPFGGDRTSSCHIKVEMSDMRFPSEASLISFAETGGHRETSKFELEDGDTKEQEPWDSLWEQPESLFQQ